MLERWTLTRQHPHQFSNFEPCIRGFLRQPKVVRNKIEGLGWVRGVIGGQIRSDKIHPSRRSGGQSPRRGFLAGTFAREDGVSCVKDSASCVRTVYRAFRNNSRPSSVDIADTMRLYGLQCILSPALALRQYLSTTDSRLQADPPIQVKSNPNTGADLHGFLIGAVFPTS